MYPQQTQYAPPMPQYPQQPQAYPAQPQYPQPAYPQGYAQPQYAPPAPQYAPPAPPQAPLPTGTLDSFYSQPASGGGPSFKFMDANRQPQIGKSYSGIVERPLSNADVRAQEQNGVVRTYKDGRPKFVLVVPMLVQPSPEFPEGKAGWWVKGQARDELARAMAEAGAPEGPPEAGAGITVQLVGVRPVPNMNPAYQYRVTYMRPQGAAPTPVQAVPPLAQPQYLPGGPVEQHNNPAAPVQPAPVPMQQPALFPQPAMVPTAATMPMTSVMVPVNTAAAAPAAAPAAVPAGFTDEQAALFAKLTGGQPQG